MSDSILLNKSRIGRITSSQAHRLMDTPAKRKTYIEEKKLEIKLGLPLETEVYSKPMAWGTFLELYMFKDGSRFDSGYISMSEPGKQITLEHPTLRWAGSPDQRNERKKQGLEFKGYGRKHFCECVDAGKQGLAVFQKECSKEYWQGVSNFILLKETIMPDIKTFAWVFAMPYESELQTIAEAAFNWPENKGQAQFRFIYEGISAGNYEQFPYLLDGGYYKDLNIFEFSIPDSDINLLTDAVRTATAELNTFEKSL